MKPSNETGTGASPVLRERTGGITRRVCMRCTRYTAIVYELGFFQRVTWAASGARLEALTQAKWNTRNGCGRRSRGAAIDPVRAARECATALALASGALYACDGRG